jgi:hypothetical protein
MNSQRAGGVAFLIGAVWFAGMALEIVVTNRRLPPDAPVADATVVDVNEEHGKFADSYVLVEFDTADGRHVRTKVTDFDWTPKPQVGDTVLVRYNAAEPNVYVRHKDFGTDVFDPVLLGMFAAVFAYGGVLGLRRRLPSWVLER